jgi:hypothetical protein
LSGAVPAAKSGVAFTQAMASGLLLAAALAAAMAVTVVRFLLAREVVAEAEETRQRVRPLAETDRAA